MYCVRVAVSQPVFGCSESTMKKPNKIRNLFKPNDKDKNNFFFHNDFTKQITDESQFFFQSTEQDLKFSDPVYWFLFLLISIVSLKKRN